MPIIDWSGALPYLPWLQALLVGFIWSLPMFLLVGMSLSMLHKNAIQRNNGLKEYANLLASQLNQEEERRHQETVKALQDIAKAIRECNEG